MTVPQAIVVRDANGPRVAVRSPGFGFELEELALAVAVKYGPRPAGAVPDAVFCIPAGDKRHIFYAQVTARGDGAAFRFVAVNQREPLDVFAWADAHPASWDATTLDDLASSVPEERRAADAVQSVLKHGDGPLLLGATQALVDGGRVLLVRPELDGQVVRDVWALLPYSTRREVFVATAAWSAELPFHLAVVPVAPDPWPAGVLTEEHALDYPPGRYELAVQLAGEAADQPELDRLFARRSSRETLRLAVSMVVAALLIAAAMKLLG